MPLDHVRFQNFFRGSMPPNPQKNFLFFNEPQISFAEKNTIEHTVEIMPSHPLNIFAMPLSAVYQHFRNERSKFRSKVVVKDSQDCDSIL